jgi:spore germination cell wall hydrolase CwlJ-like protein
MTDLDTLARTAWGEARGERLSGLQAVINVIMNRQAVSLQQGGFWWGTGVTEICRKPYQFSCWNHSDPNLQKLLLVTPETSLPFRIALDLAEKALAGELEDITIQSTHYHTASIKPKWAEGQEIRCKIGSHVFYRPDEVPNIKT